MFSSVTPCETPFGLGRCVADRKCCQDFGGIIFTADGLQTPKKELIQYRIAGINAPKNFVPNDNDGDDDNPGPGHIFPRANMIGCSDVEVCCYLQPVSSSDREISNCNVCGIKGDGDNNVVVQSPDPPVCKFGTNVLFGLYTVEMRSAFQMPYKNNHFF